MLWHRRLLLALALLGVTGSLSATLGYGWYLRSDGYRNRLEGELTDLLKMPVSIGRVQPLSATSQAFYDIRVAMPTRESELFRCAKAVWHDQSRNGRRRFGLDLSDGWLLVGTDQWGSADYQAVLRSGLGQDFAALNLQAVHLNRIDLEWRHPDITLTVAGAVGEIRYDDDGRGRASLIAYDLNGHPVAEPIKILAHFTPGAGLRFHRVELQVPVIPFDRLGLDRLLRGRVEHGTFGGRLAYHAWDDQQVLEISGAIEGARLEELTKPLVGGPFEGSVDVTLDQAVFADGRLETLRFHGRLSDLNLTDLVPALRNASLESRVQLRVHQAALRGRSIEYLSTAGQVTDLSFEAVTGLLGRGTITGWLGVDIRSLQIVDDRIQHAEIVLSAVPPEDAPGTIDRELLEWASEELIGLDLARILPAKIEYARLGARLIIDGEVLRVRGTHGPQGRTILTVRVFGRDLPVVKEFDRTFAIGPLLSELRARVETYDVDRVRTWWEKTHRSPAEAP